MRTAAHDRRAALFGLLVFVIAAGVYANSLGNGFALDDEWIILRNERVHGVDRLAEAVSSPYWPSAAAHIALYRPLTLATFAVEWEMWNGSPVGYHATNVLLHAVASVLVLALLAGLGFGSVASFAGAAIFAVHPVHTEAVANVVGRAEILATIFYILGCLLYLRRDLRPLPRVAGIALCYFLSLASKETGITLPAILLLLEVLIPRDSANVARRWREERAVYFACALTAAVYLAIRWMVLGDVSGGDAAPIFERPDAPERIPNAIRVWPEYLRLMFYPRDLVADYSPGVIMPVTGFGDPLVVFGLFVGGATLLLGVLSWGRWQVALPIFWFAITVLPVSNLVIPVGILLAERTLYLPSVAVAVLTAALATAIAFEPRRLRFAGVAVIAAALVAGAVRTWTRNPVWKSTETLIADLAATHPESFRVHWIVAGSLLRAGKVDEAFRHYAIAAELVPAHFSLLMEFGAALVVHGRAAEAERVLRRAAELMPEYVEPVVYLAQALSNQGRYRDALETVGEAIERFRGRRDIVGSISGLYHQQAQALAALGDWDAAHAARTESLRLSGTEAHWTQWRHLAEIELRRNRIQDALAALDSARAKAPPVVWPQLALEAIQNVPVDR